MNTFFLSFPQTSRTNIDMIGMAALFNALSELVNLWITTFNQCIQLGIWGYGMGELESV